METTKIDKFGSATARLRLPFELYVQTEGRTPNAGDVVVVKALSESVSYGNLELPTGRLAKINRGDCLAGVLGKRRALKGFVGDIPKRLEAGDKLHLLNMGGVVGVCSGHHSAFSDAIELEVIGAAIDETGRPLNLSSSAIAPAQSLNVSCPIIFIAGTCMNSGKTVAATEVI